MNDINSNNKSGMGFLNGEGLHLENTGMTRPSDDALPALPLGQANQTPNGVWAGKQISSVQRTPFMTAMEETQESVADPLEPSELNDGGGQSGRY